MPLMPIPRLYVAVQVINLLSGKCSPHHIRQALGHLVDEGYLYTTSDEHHYKAADC